ncbi:MAG: T9SS type A sorting domain-containing protein [Saprospiraceae bacterium]|nr:T9SS type A sorting domain-containing protein [Saprospiraceae bacterium]
MVDFESLSDQDYFKDTKITSRLHFENISKFPKNIFLKKNSIDSIDLLELVNLDSLVNLDGLEDIYELSGIMLSGNKNLENILALSNAKTAATYKHVFYPNKQYTLVLKNNPKLSYCQIVPICKMLSELPAQKFIVQGNYGDCEHSEALLDACELVDVNDDLIEHCFFLYPNPTSNYIYANFCERINEFEIFDESGVLIRKGIPNENGLNEIYIADLAKGYFLFRAILKNGKPITKGFVIR